MAQFQQIVLEYLVHYQPAKYRDLQQKRQLHGHIEALVNELHDETDRLLNTLKDEYPDRSEEYLELYAQEMAIAGILPMSTDQEGAIPSSAINTITQASSVTLGQPQFNAREAQQ